MQKFIACGALIAVLASFTLPLRADVADASVGQSLFKKNCAACHGVHGDGKGPASSGLVPPPANFTDAKFMATQKDADLVNFILHGKPGSAMQPWTGKLNETQVSALVAYIRTLAR